ncbi:MAG: 1-deoxy-D-xylulose-5-phosphate reductoisomerase [Chloroflexota bacterium]|nr:1-deoxy-D-xylulose-5-phosphate reductoisomerase [Chloroflexota bacterium]
MTTRLAVLGATGSIGRQALEIAHAHPDRLRVVALSADTNGIALAGLGVEHDVPRARLVTREDGPGALEALATADDVDLVLVATPGGAGLRATLAALEAGKSVALANKEVLVVAGHLVRALAGGGAGERLRPVDSEHAALWQCLAGTEPAQVARVILTASGGPFRDLAPEELDRVTPAQALRHPTWRMGPKVTVDSATLVNKAYEVIEAHWLFDLPYERIDVLLHRESVVHALVELADGSVMAQLAHPDMRLPIQYALLLERVPGPAPRLDWTAERTLRFGPIDARRYPCLEIVLATALSGDLGAMAGLSTADEISVERFLAGEVGFGDIPRLLRRGAEIGARGAGSVTSLPDIIEIDAAVRRALAPAAVS